MDLSCADHPAIYSFACNSIRGALLPPLSSHDAFNDLELGRTLVDLCNYLLFTDPVRHLSPPSTLCS